MSHDRITLRGMRFLGRHGVSIEERMEPQPFEVDLTLWADLATAARSDELVDTVDYAAVFPEVARIVEDTSFRLVESLAQSIAEATLLSQPRATSVEVRVRKPSAPLPGTFETVEVRLRRDREPRGDAG